MGVRPADRRRFIRTWPLILATLALTILVGLIGSIAGPKWNPTPVTSVPQVESVDVAIGGGDAPAEGTYEVQRSELRIDLGAVEVSAWVVEPVGAPPGAGAGFSAGAGSRVHPRGRDGRAERVQGAGDGARLCWRPRDRARQADGHVFHSRT